MGCALVDGPEEVFLTGDFQPRADATVYEQIERTGVPRLLLEAYRGRIEYHDPWHTDRQFSHLFRGNVDLAEVHIVFEQHGNTNLRLVDNGITERRSPTLEPDVLHTYHLIPRCAGKGHAVETHMRRRALEPADTIAIGDSRGDLEVARVVGRFYLVENAISKDPGILEAIPAGAPVTVTEEPMTAGFYEAIVRSLAEG
jgi:hydroxymethylpyrimidine pyrophosphatase-like HAD family hydrolase